MASCVSRRPVNKQAESACFACLFGGERTSVALMIQQTNEHLVMFAREQREARLGHHVTTTMYFSVTLCRVLACLGLTRVAS
jgi:hypothetical protein